MCVSNDYCFPVVLCCILLFILDVCIVCYFTCKGRRYLQEQDRCLFHGKMPSIPHEWTHVDDSPKLYDLKIDDKIMVSGTGNNWLKRRFAGINSCELPMTFPGGADSWVASGETVAWRRWRLSTKEELNP